MSDQTKETEVTFAPGEWKKDTDGVWWCTVRLLDVDATVTLQVMCDDLGWAWRAQSAGRDMLTGRGGGQVENSMASALDAAGAIHEAIRAAREAAKE